MGGDAGRLNEKAVERGGWARERERERERERNVKAIQTGKGFLTNIV